VSNRLHAAAEIILEPIKTESSWHAYRTPVKGYPLPTEARSSLAALVDVLNDAISQTLRAAPTLWIDSQPLHHDGGSKIFSVHSRLWSSKMGFCFDPVGEPPRKIRLSDLMDVDYGTPLKIHDRTAIHVTAFAQSMPAYRLLAGRGVSVLLYFAALGPDDPLLEAAVKQFMQHTRDHLRPLMSPGEFQNYPFYVPLLSTSSIASATAQQLAMWMGDAMVSIHESFDAKELLVLSRHSFNPTLQTAGLQRMSVADAGPWAFRNHSDQEGAP